MSNSPYVESRKCGYCGNVLDIDASYMGRKYHKYKPYNCGQRHISFQAKMRRGLASKSKFVVNFCRWASNNISAGISTELSMDPITNTVLRNEFFPMIKVKRKRQ